MRKIAFMIGDPAGIGPEITVRCVQEYTDRGDVSLVLVGDRGSFNRAMDITGIKLDVKDVLESEIADAAGDLLFLDVPVEGGALIPFGEVSSKAGACRITSYNVCYTKLLRENMREST